MFCNWQIGVIYVGESVNELGDIVIALICVASMIVTFAALLANVTV